MSCNTWIARLAWEQMLYAFLEAPARSISDPYVTVLSGIGGASFGHRGLSDSPLGGSIWTFALFDQ